MNNKDTKVMIINGSVVENKLFTLLTKYTNTLWANNREISEFSPTADGSAQYPYRLIIKNGESMTWTNSASVLVVNYNVEDIINKLEMKDKLAEFLKD